MLKISFLSALEGFFWWGWLWLLWLWLLLRGKTKSTQPSSGLDWIGRIWLEFDNNYSILHLACVKLSPVTQMETTMLLLSNSDKQKVYLWYWTVTTESGYREHRLATDRIKFVLFLQKKITILACYNHIYFIILK